MWTSCSKWPQQTDDRRFCLSTVASSSLGLYALTVSFTDTVYRNDRGTWLPSLATCMVLKRKKNIFGNKHVILLYLMFQNSEWKFLETNMLFYCILCFRIVMRVFGNKHVILLYLMCQNNDESGFPKLHACIFWRMSWSHNSDLGNPPAASDVAYGFRQWQNFLDSSATPVASRCTPRPHRLWWSKAQSLSPSMLFLVEWC